MMRMAFFVLSLLLASEAASAATATGSSGLALASLVAAQSPLLAGRERSVMARMFAGHLNFSFPANRTIAIRADAVTCRASNVDITSRACDLNFGAKRVSVKGRKAHELFATIAQVGVPPDGAAGTIRESLSVALASRKPARPLNMPAIT